MRGREQLIGDFVQSEFWFMHVPKMRMNWRKRRRKKILFGFKGAKLKIIINNNFKNKMFQFP